MNASHDPESGSSALLKFQIGPVQDFIAQARSTRDFWSGSFLLSWLVAAGIRELGRQLAKGSLIPSECFAKARESLIFPAVEAQPLIQFFFDGTAPGDFLGTTELLTPNLPNIFVFKVETEPTDATRLARAIEKSIREEWRGISDQCWVKCLRDGIVSTGFQERFQRQVDRFLSIAWQVVPLRGGYAKVYETLSKHLDAVRQCRDFKAWRAGRWRRDAGGLTEKDTLSGKEEAIIGGRKWFDDTKKATSHWDDERKKRKSLWNILLREKHAGDYLGAITLIKRIWHWHYLHDEKGVLSLHTKEASTSRTQFPFPSTRHIALHRPWSNLEDESDEEERQRDRLDGYFAVLAFDGDSIGKWVSGDYCSLDEKWHGDFSQRLSTFALKCVRPIVDACDGRLIYAGGDDVLALLPPDTVLDCARFLRMAYRGDFSFLAQIRNLASSLIDRNPETSDQERGTILHESAFSPHRQNAKKAAGIFADPPSLGADDLPGGLVGFDSDLESLEKTNVSPDASVGIAIAHFKDPLQDVILSAKASEKRAKHSRNDGGMGRSAVSISLLKRSGEHLDWGCQWDSGGLELYDLLANARQAGKVSSRFPYRVAQVLSAYSGDPKSDAPGFDAKTVIKVEFAHVLDRQSGDGFEKSNEGKAILKALVSFLDYLSDQSDKNRGLKATRVNQFLLSSVVGLCQTLAFTIRDQEPSEFRDPTTLPPAETAETVSS